MRLQIRELANCLVGRRKTIDEDVEFATVKKAIDRLKGLQNDFFMVVGVKGKDQIICTQDFEVYSPFPSEVLDYLEFQYPIYCFKGKRTLVHQARHQVYSRKSIEKHYFDVRSYFPSVRGKCLIPAKELHISFKLGKDFWDIYQ